jgi:hypothetical protein
MSNDEVSLEFGGEKRERIVQAIVGFGGGGD